MALDENNWLCEIGHLLKMKLNDGDLRIITAWCHSNKAEWNEMEFIRH